MTKDFLIKFSNIDTHPFKQYINKCKIIEVDITDRSTKGNSKQLNFEDPNGVIKLGQMVLSYVKEIENELISKKLKMSAAWIVEGNKGSYHRLHNHTVRKANATYQEGISCVLYLDVPDNIDRGQFYFLLRKNDGELDMNGFHPNKGDLIVMSKTVFHGVYPQTSEGLRRTLNVDFIYDK